MELNVKSAGLVLLVIAGVVGLWTLMEKKPNADGLTIGILQTASHPALNLARDGFVQELHKQLGERVSFITQNAEGSMATAQTIAHNFHCNRRIHALCAVGTMATQALIQAEKQKPIFFTAVSDPSMLGITSTNVCGVGESVDIEVAATAIADFFPKTTSVALLFNPAEVNSVSLIKRMESALQQRHIASMRFGVNIEAEIPTTAMIAAQRADILFVPTDNLLANAVSLIASIGLKAKKPLFICDSLLVKNGVFAAAGGTDYFKCGQLVAQGAIKVLLEQQKPIEVAQIGQVAATDIVVSKQACIALRVKLPETNKQITLVT